MKLSASHLEIGYEGKSILNDINFEAESGDLIVVVGKNGSGKSTLLKTITSIIPKKSGNLYFDTMDITGFGANQIVQYISAVLTDKLEVPLRVKEILQLGRQGFTDAFDRLTDKDSEVIQEVSEMLNIEHLWDRKIDELSDGERQKVMIARALVQQTPILILDEPTTHLDLENKAIILKILKYVSKEERKIVIFSTHDINLVLPFAKKLWLIDKQKFQVIEMQRPSGTKLKIFDKEHIEYDTKCKCFRVAK